METKLTYADPDPHGVKILSQEIDCHLVIASLLYNRGIQTPGAARFFLNPTFEQLKDPFGLMDMDKAVERIHTACGADGLGKSRRSLHDVNPILGRSGFTRSHGKRHGRRGPVRHLDDWEVRGNAVVA